MGNWIVMLFVDLLIPLIMIGFGTFLAKNPPKEIGGIYGYRTSMSMKNKDTWEFAHHHWGKTGRASGWAMLVVSVITMLLVIGKNENTILTVGTIVIMVQPAAIIATIFPTERALKETFDEDGNRKV